MSREIKIKLSPTQVDFVTTALENFNTKCHMRFSEPTISNGILRVDPHDLLELTHYIEKRFDNELEIQRLKKAFINTVPKKLRERMVNF